MLRLLCLCLFGFPLLAFAGEEKDVPKELLPFQGVWRVIKAEGGGKGVPEKLTEEVRFAFAGRKLTIREGKGPIQEGSYAVTPDASPSEIDLIDPKNNKIPGIYKFDSGKLTICFVKKPGSPRPKKFGEADAVQLVLEQVKEKDKPEAKKEVAKEMVPFQGPWKVVKIELGGKPPPGTIPAMRFVFKADAVEIAEGKEAPSEGGYTVDPKKEPAEIDLITPQKKKIPGIYRFDKNGQLVISLLANPNGKRPTKFDEADTITYVLEKAKE